MTEQHPTYRFLDAGDSALVVEFGNSIDKSLVNAVAHLRVHVLHLHEKNLLPGLLETIPTFRSLAIVINPLLTSVDAVKLTLEQNPTTQIANQSAQDTTTLNDKRSAWRLPVCYQSNYGPDLESVAQATDLKPAEIIQLHTQQTYQVYLLGFQPGYGFLGDTNTALHLPRRAEPRLRIPAGSVAIAMKLTCVYPWESPGGWHLLGRCPVPMFDAKASRPTLLSPSDTVRFEAITENDFTTLEADRKNGSLDWKLWRDC